MRKVPFVPNAPDGTHCEQAALKMILEYFEPEQDYTFEFLDEISGKIQDKWTWPQAFIVWLHQNNYDVVSKESFDNDRFAAEGIAYLHNEFSPEVAQGIIENNDIESGKHYAKEMAQQKLGLVGIPSLQELQGYLSKKYLLICNVNSRLLNNQNGFSGHAVVIITIDERGVTLHDPGPPAIESRLVPIDHFVAAWSYGGDNYRSFIAIRKS